MFCAECGKPMPDGAKFCAHCGAAVPAAAAARPAGPSVSEPAERFPSSTSVPPAPSSAASSTAGPPGYSATPSPASMGASSTAGSGLGGTGGSTPGPSFGASAGAAGSNPAGGANAGGFGPTASGASTGGFGSTGSSASAGGFGAPGSSAGPGAAATGTGGTGATGPSVAGFGAAGAAASMMMGTDPKGLLARIKGILLSPSTEWPIIAAEPATKGSIYLQYVAPLVAIGAIATFIGQSLVGFNVPLLGHIRMPVIGGLVTAVMSFLLSFLGVFLIALLVDALAPTFGGQKDPIRALKVTAYSYTPGWVAAILHIIPALSVISILAALYGLYLLYLGLPVLMRCPKEKSVGYTIVLVICAIVVSIVVGALSAVVAGGLGLGAMSAAGALSHTRSDARENAAVENVAGALSGIFGGKTDADKARVSDALQKLAIVGEQAEQAERAARAGGSANPSGAANVDVNAALGAVGQIMTGGKEVHAVDFHRLKDMLPDSLPGMKRDEAEGQSNEAMGVRGSSATARYSNEAGGRVSLEIADMGSLSGLAGLAARFDPKVEKETDTGYERTTTVNGQLVHERYDRRARSGEVSVLAANRFSVTVNGSNVDPEVLTATLKRVDVTALAAVK